MGRHWIAVGAVSAAAAVALGAFGAHGLEGRLPAARLASFEVGVRYHLVHSLGLLLVGVLLQQRPSRGVRWAGRFLLAGVLLFSGGLYVWGLTALRPAVHVVPVGGVAFIIGWLCLAAAVWRSSHEDSSV